MITVKNPPRVTVAIGSYSGPAVVDGNRLLFQAKARDIKRATTGTIDGKPVTILSVSQSAVVAALVEVVFEEVAA